MFTSTMFKIFVFIPLLITISINPCFASDSTKLSNVFMNLYTKLCLKHVANLDVLRNKLNAAPSLPAEKASNFLNGYQGKAWPVPNKNGLFVVAITTKKNICMVYARRGNTSMAEESFKAFLAKPKKPLISKLLLDEYGTTAVNGKTHTLSYEWAIPNASKAMLFTLTTANSDKAQLQLMGSATIIKK